MKNITKETILEYLSSNKSELREKYGVIKIGLFGSYARGEESDDSDIDLAIEIEKDKKNISNFFGLKREMERVFDKKVDLGIESSLKPIAKKYILKEILYA
jgi:predicted nucleotidyltransferase